MFTLDPDVLLAAGRDLTRHGLDVADDCRVPAPDTGQSSGLTAAAVEVIVRRAGDVADDLHDLGDRLDSFVVGAVRGDASIGALIDWWRAGHFG